MSKVIKVVVIDDSSFNRETIVQTLNSHPDFEVIGTASDGEVGLKLAMTLSPDLVTLDLEMPRMDGFTFLRLIMEQKPMPVLVVSAHSRAQDVFNALDLGAYDFVAKSKHFFPEKFPNVYELKSYESSRGKTSSVVGRSFRRVW